MLKRQTNGWAALLGAMFLICAGGVAIAGPYSANDPPFSVTIRVDENGHGLFTNTAGFSGALPFALQNDPGPGGAANVLTYSLLNPPGLTAGDVLFDAPGTLEPGITFGGDVVRFNPSEICADGSVGCLAFYSDNVDGFDSLADTSGPPGALYANVAHVAEVGVEGNNYAIYTPIAGQPGFVAGAAGPVTYVLISDAPEPASLGIFLVGLAGLGLAWNRRHQAS
jgi:PEP-CTERM motif